jgi:hypothetical protein
MIEARIAKATMVGSLACPMCMSAMVWAAMGGVVWGTSIEQLRQFGINQISIPATTVIGASPFYRGEILGHASLMDYAMPRADSLPLFRTIGTAVHRESELPEPARLKGLCGAAHFQHDDAGRLRSR